jgi:hypothetical protein
MIAVHWETFKLRREYKLHNGPGDELCRFWATLAVLKVKEKDSAAFVRVEKKEVFELLKK